MIYSWQRNDNQSQLKEDETKSDFIEYITLHESKSEETFSQGVLIKWNLHHPSAFCRASKKSVAVSVVLELLVKCSRTLTSGIRPQIIDPTKHVPGLPVTVEVWDECALKI